MNGRKPGQRMLQTTTNNTDIAYDTGSHTIDLPMPPASTRHNIYRSRRILHLQIKKIPMKLRSRCAEVSALGSDDLETPSLSLQLRVYPVLDDIAPVVEGVHSSLSRGSTIETKDQRLCSASRNRRFMRQLGWVKHSSVQLIRNCGLRRIKASRLHRWLRQTSIFKRVSLS